MTELLILANAAATLLMTGVIWVTQVAVYPSFGQAEPVDFGKNHDEYRLKIALVATAPMLVEASTSALLLIYRPEWVPAWQVWTGLGLVGVIWLSTLLLQVPLHERLSAGLDREAVRGLVATNWVRTVAWTLRAVLVVWWLKGALER